jgi:hypothetical protein
MSSFRPRWRRVPLARRRRARSLNAGASPRAATHVPRKWCAGRMEKIRVFAYSRPTVVSGRSSNDRASCTEGAPVMVIHRAGRRRSNQAETVPSQILSRSQSTPAVVAASRIVATAVVFAGALAFSDRVCDAGSSVDAARLSGDHGYVAVPLPRDVSLTGLSAPLATLPDQTITVPQQYSYSFPLQAPAAPPPVLPADDAGVPRQSAGAGDLSTFLNYLVGGSETTPDSAAAAAPAPDFIRLLVPGVLLDGEGASPGVNN